MHILRQEHRCLVAIAAGADQEQQQFIALLRAHVRQPHVVPLLAKDTKSSVYYTAELARLKLERNFSDADLDAIARCLLQARSARAPLVRAAITDYSHHVWRNPLCVRYQVNSLIDWFHILLLIPSIEEHIQDPSDAGENEEELLICEYSETPRYRALCQTIAKRHAVEGRVGVPVVIAYGDYIDKHAVHKGSCEAIMYHILNMRRKVRDLPFMQLLVAELPGARDDTNIVRRALLPEQMALADGIEMWVASRTGVAWVYGVMDLQIADTQEQYKNVSCAAPGGNASFFCCPVCLASRDDFGSGRRGEPRPSAASTHAIVAEAARLPTFKAAKAFLRDHGLMPSAICNPNIFLPGVDSISELQGRDPLHICLHDGADAVKSLAPQLAPVNRNIIEHRIVVARQYLKGGRAPSSLRVVATWRAHEALAFVLTSPWILETLLPAGDACTNYFNYTATIHFLLTSAVVLPRAWSFLLDVLYTKQRAALHDWLPEPVVGGSCSDDDVDDEQPQRPANKRRATSSSSSAAAAAASSSSSSSSTTTTAASSSSSASSASRGLLRQTLGNHQVMHLSDDVQKWGPLCMVSSQVFEHAQGDVASYAQMRTQVSDEHAFRMSIARQLNYLAQLQCPTATQTKADLVAATTLLHDNGDGSVVYSSMVIKPGSVVVRLLTWQPPEGDRELPFVEDLMEFYEVQRVDVDNESVSAILLRPPRPKRRLPLCPFVLQHDVLGPVNLPLSSCNRVVATVPMFKESSAAPAVPLQMLVLPTRFI